MKNETPRIKRIDMKIFYKIKGKAIPAFVITTGAYILTMIVFFLMSSCGVDEDLIDLRFQAAFPTFQCEGLDPAYMVLQYDDQTVTRKVKEIEDGVISDKFTVGHGSITVKSVVIYNDQDQVVHFVKDQSESHKEEVNMWVPFTQKVNPNTRIIAGEIHCK